MVGLEPGMKGDSIERVETWSGGLKIDEQVSCGAVRSRGSRFDGKELAVGSYQRGAGGTR
jgi:hypothetical protein